MAKTENKILQKARELFSCKGYHSASIREIAKKAGVNVASINYHFGSKENLLLTVMETGHQQMSDEFSKIVVSNKTITFRQLSIELLHLFLAKKDLIIPIFRLVLLHERLDLKDFWKKNRPHFPFGIIHFQEVLKREIGHDIKEKDIFWAVHVVNVQILHLILMIESGHAEGPIIGNLFGKNFAEEVMVAVADSILEHLSK
ncbi:MAG: TetR/AcrR family transcriptional regulator [Oligoflexia bacterium]|nr:TetR/AcrR family transcriptional regulator [Oligoflexia bacterium]MBF0366016.1 TetR/AcrR family transcriptional regulator [Oligoflexia bacterium]